MSAMFNVHTPIYLHSKIFEIVPLSVIRCIIKCVCFFSSRECYLWGILVFKTFGFTNYHAKCIQLSTNMPSIGLEMREILRNRTILYGR